MTVRAIKENKTQSDEPSLVEEIISSQCANDRETTIVRQRKHAKDTPGNITPPFIGNCLDTHHPTLMGRALIRWELNGVTEEMWLPTLHGMSLRENDRVLVQTPANDLEPIVVGVVDGFKRRLETDKETGPSLTLLRDESIKVTTEEGERLLEIYREESGPVVKLFDDATNIALPNDLRISAKSIELNAREGQAKITARDDVVVEGEMIKLNS